MRNLFYICGFKRICFFITIAAFCFLFQFFFVYYYASGNQTKLKDARHPLVAGNEARITVDKVVSNDQSHQPLPLPNNQKHQPLPLPNDQRRHQPLSLPELKFKFGCSGVNTKIRNSWERGVVTQVNPPIVMKHCKELAAGKRDQPSVNAAVNELKSWKQSPVDLYKMLSDCNKVKEDFHHNFYVSEEEEKFPLAFTFVISANPFQIIRLLKAIYRPHNYYCFHPDAKKSEEYIGIFRQLSVCLDNIFVAKKLYKVYYAHHTIMDAELSCMEELAYRYSNWKYTINIAGQELPLKTNREIVKSLKGLNGKSGVIVESIVGGYFHNERLKWELALNLTKGQVYYTKRRLPPAPHNIPVYKGAHFVSLTPEFVHFILTNQKVIDLRNWLKMVFVPEEEFFPSAYMLPEAPGGGLRGSMVPEVDKYIWMYPGTIAGWNSH